MTLTAGFSFIGSYVPYMQIHDVNISLTWGDIIIMNHIIDLVALKAQIYCPVYSIAIV